VDGLALTVLLRHDLPDGSGHYDWLLECPGRTGLTAFRVAERIDRADCSEFEAERMADHRREYLTYEGPVSGGRGGVVRLARGSCEVEERPGFVRVRADFDGHVRTYEGRLLGGDRWAFLAF
jgi:hypothetical protein